MKFRFLIVGALGLTALLFVVYVRDAYADGGSISCKRMSIRSAIVSPDGIPNIKGRLNGIFVTEDNITNQNYHPDRQQVVENEASKTAPIKGSTATLVSFGPLLDVVDSREIQTTSECSDDGIVLTETIKRMDSIAPNLRKNIPWSPTASFQITLNYPKATIYVEWVVHAADGKSRKWVAEKSIHRMNE
jgi:hypothetical protein